MTDIETNVFKKDGNGNVFAIPTVRFLNTTSSGIVKTGDGTVHGILVNSHSSGTIRLSDATSATTPNIMNTYTLPAGPQILDFGAGIKFSTGLHAVVGGTADITILYN